MFLQRIRKSKFSKVMSCLLALSMFNNVFQINTVFALTSGPDAPEFTSFTPIGVTDMVDPFSGNFGYNIPLFEVPGPNGGYPFNLSYQSDIGMDQEASWVGLGWVLNPGNIQRSVRGIPDDFNGKKITHTLDMMPTRTIGGSLGFNFEAFGGDASKALPREIGINIKLYFNNKTGWGMGTGGNLSFLAKEKGGMKLMPGFGINSDSQNGGSCTVNLSLQSKEGNYKKTYSGGITLASESGIGISLNYSKSKFKTEKVVDKRATRKANRKLKKEGKEATNEVKTKDVDVRDGDPPSSYWASMSFSRPSYVPDIPNEYTGISFSAGVQLGGSIVGAFPDVSFRAFYSDQKLKNNINQQTEAFGYMYLGNGTRTDKRMLDYDVEKGGMLGEKTPNLGMPNLQYDIYTIQGQGISGMFRPYRSDIGVVSDSKMEYATNGFDLGGDFGGFKVGVNGEYSRTVNTQDKWKDDQTNAALFTNYIFKVEDETVTTINDYQPVYFKMHGEHTSYSKDQMANIGYSYPIYVPFSTSSDEGFIQNHFVKGNGEGNLSFQQQNYQFSSSLSIDNRRMPTNTAIIPLKNSEIHNNDKYSVDGVNYQSRIMQSQFSTSASFEDIKSDIGGYSITQSNGSRYNYMIPSYNLVQEELMYSVAQSGIDREKGIVNLGSRIDHKIDGTEKYKSYKKTPPYATSYLLTSILGPDYVDVDGNGPSENDLGYWVKFNYSHKPNYTWRAPFDDAMYVPGSETFREDDKGSFTYGVREQYYLESVETKTHKAFFDISSRQDAIGALPYGGKNASSVTYKLDRIKLFSKQELDLNGELLNTSANIINSIPIKVVNFEYEDTNEGDLCTDILNHQDKSIQNGKLTLHKVYFTYGKSTRGENSPYIFDYGLLPTGEKSNPRYNPIKVDRWGNYKEINYSNFNNPTKPIKDLRDFPYNVQSASQIDDITTEEFNTLKQREATAWQLTDIILPSGGKIKVEYEQDDYAYVQHQKANQMFFIESFDNGILYDKNSWNKGSERGNFEDRKVYFKLQDPIAISDVNNNEFFNSYILPLKRNDKYQVYFRIKSEIKPGYKEFIPGYADLELDASGKPVCGIVQDSDKLNGNGKCQYGYIVLAPTKISKLDNMRIIRPDYKYYHPFAVAGWQYIKLNAMHILNSGVDNFDNFENERASQKITILRAAAASCVGLLTTFKDYTKKAFDNDYAVRIIPEESVIRLGMPNGKKYGGGTRVKKIYITDNWDELLQNQTSITASNYGQVFSYTKVENNKIISSGVANYEPYAGGDENSLRYAKQYPGVVKFGSDNNLFFEYPINESLYPGAAVGYSNVLVNSLATEEMKNNNLITGDGYIKYEYYTAQDFPVMSFETDLSRGDAKKIHNPFPIIIPLIGQTEVDKISASQGYVTILNDMHGKMKSMSQYSTKSDGTIGDLINKISYHYKCTETTYEDVPCYKLNNVMAAGTLIKKDMASLDPSNINKYKVEVNDQEMIMGEEYEFIIEAKHKKMHSHQEGVDVNADFLTFFPCPTPWPSFLFQSDELNTIITNKVIHRSGILETTTTQEKGSVVQKVTNEMYDMQSGQVLLTSAYTGDKVNSTISGDQKQYTYTIPAFKQNTYKRMGQAYKNQNLILPIDNMTKTDASVYEYESVLGATTGLTTDLLKELVLVGDEFIVTNPSGNFVANAYVKKVWENNGSIKISYISDGYLNTEVDHFFKTVRSGNRNMLEVSAGNIISLNNPTINRTAIDMGGPCIYTKNLYNEIQIVLNKVLGFTDPDFGYSEIDILNKLKTLFPVNFNSYTREYYLLNGIGSQEDFDIDKFFALTIAHDVLMKTYSTKPAGFVENNTIFNYIVNNNETFTIYKWNIGYLYVKTSKSIISSCTNNNTLLSYSFGIPYFYYKWDPDLGIVDVKRIPSYQNPLTVEEVIGGAQIHFDSPVLDGYSATNQIENLTKPGGDYTDIVPSKDYIVIPNVLQASAVTYSTGIGMGTPIDNTKNFRDIQKSLLWQPNTTFTFNEKRLSSLFVYDPVSQKVSATGDSPNILTDGVFNPFRYFMWDQNTYYNNSIAHWIPTETITKYASNGLPCESINALGIYSAIDFDTYANQPFMVAQNAKKNEIAFIDFESSTPNSIYEVSSIGVGQSTEVKHSGLHSDFIRGVDDSNEVFGIDIGLADIKPSETYIVQFWVKTTGTDVNASSHISVETISQDMNIPYTYGNWKLVNQSITTPTSIPNKKIFFEITTSIPNGSDSKIYFDDIRVFPKNASMQNYVYDPTSYKLSAIIDQNGYASYYYYDEAGSLYLVKKETIDGIKTLNENILHQSEINR